jgi:tRNA (guanine-N7-)-methyltransferase
MTTVVSETKVDHKPKYLSSFARRVGKGLRANQKRLLAELLPQIEITTATDFNMLFSENKEIILEIGFGNGEHLFKQALNNQDKLYIGAEPYLNGVAALLTEIEKHNLTNVKIYTDDVRKILEVIPENYFGKIFVICPDPWPKRKQNKRRLINSEFIQLLRSKLKTDSTLIIATDHIDYAGYVLKELNKLSDNFLQNLNDYTQLPKDWIYTKYQKRGIANGSLIYCFEIKKNA